MYYQIHRLPHFGQHVTEHTSQYIADKCLVVTLVNIFYIFHHNLFGGLYHYSIQSFGHLNDALFHSTINLWTCYRALFCRLLSLITQNCTTNTSYLYPFGDFFEKCFNQLLSMLGFHYIPSNRFLITGWRHYCYFLCQPAEIVDKSHHLKVQLMHPVYQSKNLIPKHDLCCCTCLQSRLWVERKLCGTTTTCRLLTTYFEN